MQIQKVQRFFPQSYFRSSGTNKEWKLLSAMFVGAVDYGTILKLLRGAAVQMQGLSVEALCIKLIKIFMLTMFRKNSIFHFPSIFFTRIFKSEISFNLFFIEIKKTCFQSEWVFHLFQYVELIYGKHFSPVATKGLLYILMMWRVTLSNG